MSQFVFQLVKQMTKREKAYFKRSASLHSQSTQKNYLRLFEVVDQMTNYSLQAIADFFLNEPMGQHLSTEFSYLQKQLLKSLADFHVESSPQRQQQKAILFIDILLEKGFRKQALKYIRQSKRLAYKHEHFTNVLQLIQWEEEVLFTEGILGFTKKLAALQQERKKIYEQIRNLNELRLLRERARELQFFQEEPTEQAASNTHLSKHALLEASERAFSLKALEHYYYIHIILHYLKGEYAESQATGIQCLSLMKQHPYLFKSSRLLPIISNLLYHSVLNTDSDAFFLYLPELENLANVPSIDLDYIVYIRYVRLFDLAYHHRDQAHATKLLLEATPFAKQKMATLGAAQANFFLLLLVRNNIFTMRYEIAIDWLNMWGRFGVLNYTLMHFRIFSLILYYELNWLQLLQVEISNTYKILKKHKRYNAVAQAFLRFFKKQLKAPLDLSAQLASLYRALAAIDQSTTVKLDFIYADFLAWVEEKQALAK